MKTKVRMISVDQYKEWEIGEEGYIDGYVQGGNGAPLAAVVLKNRVVLSPIYCLQVISD